MFFARDKNLFDLLLPHYGDDALHQVQDAFTLMDLPMPEQMEYRDTTDVGALVLLNPYGSTIRITNRKKLMSETALRHPRILQPLGTFPDTTLRIDIFPGIRPLKGTGVPPCLFDDLEESALDFADSKALNCGVLHDPAQGGREYTVVLDTPAVEKMYTAPIPEDRIQTQLYGHLRQAFAHALRAGKFDAFWSLCAAEHHRGLLRSSWAESIYSLVHDPAAVYEKRLAQYKGISQPAVGMHYSGYNLGALF